VKSAGVLFLGLVAFAFGTLFALQGAGIIPWPRESFMIGQRDWIEYGIVIALIGLALILTTWRIRR
jgi:hypothetical protein